tara:strand:- start:113 stop:253 length:141 start_codon:yes stop_codon:yes gene_type:complete
MTGASKRVMPLPPQAGRGIRVVVKRRFKVMDGDLWPTFRAVNNFSG